MGKGMRLLIAMCLLASCAPDTSAPSGDAGDGGGGGGDGNGSGGGSGDGNGSGGPANGDDATASRSGTRIKLRYMTTPDGAKIFQGVFDTQRNEECYFGTAADGQTRCLPTGIVFAYAAGYFADASCTQPAAIFYGTCATPPRYAVSSVDDPSCAGPARTKFFQVGALLSSAYSKSGTSCIAVTPNPGYRFFLVGPEIPASSFQAGTPLVE